MRVANVAWHDLEETRAIQGKLSGKLCTQIYSNRKMRQPRHATDVLTNLSLKHDRQPFELSTSGIANGVAAFATAVVCIRAGLLLEPLRHDSLSVHMFRSPRHKLSHSCKCNVVSGATSPVESSYVPQTQERRKSWEKRHKVEIAKSHFQSAWVFRSGGN